MESTLKKFKIQLYPKAFQNLDDIYSYILNEIKEPIIAKRKIDRLWEGIGSLEFFPYSHQDRLVGKYANKGYKQLIIGNYVVIYKIDEQNGVVFIITIQYAGRNI